MSVMSKITVQNGLNCVSTSKLANRLCVWTRNRVFTCRHRSPAPAVYPCHVPFMPVFAQLAWPTELACYTVISETRAAGNLRVQYLDYRCESVFRRDKLSECMCRLYRLRVRE